MQGLLLEVIQKAAPEAYQKRIMRQGVVNAWNDPSFADAVRKTGKKQLIVAGVTTDVCLVPPALSMQGEGFHIKVLARLLSLDLPCKFRNPVIDSCKSVS